MRKINKMPKIGRPTKLTKQMREEVVKLVKVGNYVETACAVVGISKNTYYDWLKKARESKRRNKYTIFRDEVEKAQAWSEARDVALISRHAETNWRPAAWKLERKHPDRWGKDRKEEKIKHVSSDVSHIQSVDREVVKRVLDAMASRPQQDQK